VDEGSSVNLDASSSSDSDGTIDSYAWDFDSDGDYDDATGVSPSFSAANLDGPSSHTVGLQVTDDDSATGTDTATIDVINVVPTITDLTASSQGAVTGKQVTFTGTVSDPAPADTHTWEWSVNGGQSYSSGSNPFTYTFPSCGTFNISAIATDDDGGISQPRALANPVSVYNASFSPPVDAAPYVNTLQKGRVIPVKISVGCASNLTGLSPSIQLLTGDKTDGSETTADEIETYSVSSADTTGVMRAADGGYIYNLRVPDVANAYYTVRVNAFGGSNASSNMYALLKTRK
jgi:hypothetical protein